MIETSPYDPTDDTETGTPLLFGRVLDGHGGARAVSWEEAQEWRPGKPGEMLWVHLCRNADGVAEWLDEGLGLPEPTVELLTSEDTRPRAFREGNALVATLRGINFNPGAEPEDMVSLQVWCDGRRLVTLRRRPLQTPRAVMAELDKGTGALDAGAVITLMVEHMIARMNRSIIDMNEVIDQLEETDPDEDPEAMLDKIATIRRNCLGLKRHMAPQHEALERISREAPEWFEKHDRREIAETIDRLRRYLDDLDISKESAVVLQDDLRARAAASADRTSYLLTIVAAIFLPLSFVTGLLGINVGGMPGMQDPDAFWVVVALCAAILLVQLVMFWKWKLF
ncbi:zinc transporter ZntB [Novosphingobium mangrovi (ex Hu et al. 2023)]|uniref:Zinc transporter ZntB n=1 Tax=Novosphingobium mangrovi (ex Hu et al. 2023) TaxID=2930094 RepID=A0ABT0ADV0_9SPHN|nr:zinc transporter ZntB [Novosphingobium mangrovi (ex Hu et al. 2023)]MCJ1961373.1 zinc transporter ZntB [Novosphingobium mangrovi (ex Hu et al. 2023)]